MSGLVKTLAKPLPALASVATIVGLYVALLAVQEAELTRIAQHEQFLAEKAPRVVATRIYATDAHVLVELQNDGESDARRVGVAKGFTRPDGSRVSDWEFTAAETTLRKGESARLYVTDIKMAQAILGYVPREFEARRFAKAQQNAGVLQVAIIYQDAYGNPMREEADFVARP